MASTRGRTSFRSTPAPILLQLDSKKSQKLQSEPINLLTNNNSKSTNTSSLINNHPKSNKIDLTTPHKPYEAQLQTPQKCVSIRKVCLKGNHSQDAPSGSGGVAGNSSIHISNPTFATVNSEQGKPMTRVVTGVPTNTLNVTVMTADPPPDQPVANTLILKVCCQ